MRYKIASFIICLLVIISVCPVVGGTGDENVNNITEISTIEYLDTETEAVEETSETIEETTENEVEEKVVEPAVKKRIILPPDPLMFGPNEEEEYAIAEIKYLTDVVNQAKNEMDAAHNLAENGRLLGYQPNHPVMELAQEEYETAKMTYDKYGAILQEKNIEKQKHDTELKWAEKTNEYPDAVKIWRYLSEELGYSDIVCAGIMGNIMVECGGGTLNIQWWLYGHSAPLYYGMCMWYKPYCPEVYGQDLDFQLDFLASNIESSFDECGAGNYNRFINSSNVNDAAYRFARWYERCAPTDYNYQIRENCAWKAYKYFHE